MSTDVFFVDVSDSSLMAGVCSLYRCGMSSGVLQCVVAVCCSALQYVCCSDLFSVVQQVAVICSSLTSIIPRWWLMCAHCIHVACPLVCCSVLLQCVVAVCCSALQNVCCSMLQRFIQYGAVCSSDLSFLDVIYSLLICFTPRWCLGYAMGGLQSVGSIKL